MEHAGAVRRGWATAALLGLVVGCGAGEPMPTGTAEAKGGLSGDTGPGACTEQSADFGALEVSETAVATVPRVAWRAPEGAESWLIVAGADGVERQTASAEGAAREELLVGLHQRSRYQVRPVAEVDGALVCGPVATIETGSLPSTLPPLTAEVAAPSEAGGLRVVPIIGESALHAVVIDDMGAVIWAKLLWEDEAVDEGGPRAPGGAVTAMRAVLDPLGGGLLFNLERSDEDKVSHVVSMGWDGVERGRLAFPRSHTDFAALPDGGVAMLGWDLRSYGDRNMLGDTILLRPAGSGPEAEPVVLWSVFDIFEPDLGRDYHTSTMFEVEDVEDWSHVNSIWYEAADDAFYVTISHLNALARVDRATGHTDWVVVEGRQSDFATVEPHIIDAPHSVQPTDDGLLVFNRTSASSAETCSGSDELGLDWEGSSVSRLWEWRGDSCMQVGFLGNSQRIPTGLTLTSWSVLGVLDEVDREGVSDWRLSLGLGAAFGFVTWAPLPPEVLQ